MLDEPTNHLDVESREALEDAIDAYDGTVLFVSHDRALIDAVATHTLALEDQTLTLRIGDYNDFMAAKEQAAAPPPPPPRAAAPKADKPKPAAAAQAPKPAPANRTPQRVRRKLADLEGRVAEREAEIARLESELADPGHHRRLRVARHRRREAPRRAGGALLAVPRVGVGRRSPPR